MKKLQIASNNESYVINALQFIGLMDEEGKRTDIGHSVMTKHDEEEFKKEFADLIRKAYIDLFELRGEEAWELPKADLIGYFRSTDKTSDTIGTRQAAVFQAFSTIAGYDPPGGQAKQALSKPRKKKATAEPVRNTKAAAVRVNRQAGGNDSLRKDMALTVRVEINLPAEGSKETYDNIFKSIKENLLND